MPLSQYHSPRLICNCSVCVCMRALSVLCAYPSSSISVGGLAFNSSSVSLSAVDYTQTCRPRNSYNTLALPLVS